MTTFKVTTKDNKEIELKFVSPSAEDLIEADKIYNSTFADRLNNKNLLRKQLANKLREQGLWNDGKQKELDELQEDIVKQEYKLHKGKIKLSQAKKVALDIRQKRYRQRTLLNDYHQYDNNTVEGQADGAKFNYLVYACTVYNKGEKRYFENYEDFLTYSDPVAFVAAAKYASEFYGLGENSESLLPENKFLKNFEFVDDHLRLVDKDGNLVDENGKRIDELGNVVDKQGNIIDNYGYKRDQSGNFADNSEPFLDDDGNVIKVDSDKDSA